MFIIERITNKREFLRTSLGTVINFATKKEAIECLERQPNHEAFHVRRPIKSDFKVRSFRMTFKKGFYRLYLKNSISNIFPAI